jgi:hypothetical protein
MTDAMAPLSAPDAQDMPDVRHAPKGSGPGRRRDAKGTHPYAEDTHSYTGSPAVAAGRRRPSTVLSPVPDDAGCAAPVSGTLRARRLLGLRHGRSGGCPGVHRGRGRPILPGA